MIGKITALRDDWIMRSVPARVGDCALVYAAMHTATATVTAQERSCLMAGKAACEKLFAAASHPTR